MCGFVEDVLCKVRLQLKDPLELPVKIREFLPCSGFLSRRHMTQAVESDVNPQTFLPLQVRIPLISCDFFHSIACYWSSSYNNIHGLNHHDRYGGANKLTLVTILWLPLTRGSPERGGHWPLLHRHFALWQPSGWVTRNYPTAGTPISSCRSPD